MRKFHNPLDNICIASPCAANWDEMFGTDRKRFCSECKLNVHNLSDMTRLDAENLLITSEGRLCVQFYRRSDGTILTRDCPVGWRAVKQRASRAATAFLSMMIAFVGGVFGLRAAQSLVSFLTFDNVPAASPAKSARTGIEDGKRLGPKRNNEPSLNRGRVDNLDQIKRQTVVGQIP